MDVTFRARFRVLSILIVALVGIAGCASADSGEQAAAPSATATPASTSDVGFHLEAVEPALQSALVEVMDRYQVPGAAVMVTTNAGSWSLTHGLADLEANAVVVEDMEWPLRSVTKSVVVTVLLQLVDEGQLSLEDTIDTYIDSVPNGDEITLRQLANMSSGVGDYTHSEAFIETLREEPSQHFSLEVLNTYGLAESPQFEPGTDYVYSNTSTNLLGVVIEEVTGQSIGETIDERIIEELELDDTFYAETDGDWASPHAQGYQLSEGSVKPIFNNFSAMGASGAMVSTTEDMTVWVEALATGLLISHNMHQEMLEGAPLTEGPEYDEYALGIGSIDGWWGHTGEGLGFSSLVMYEAESGSTVVIFMNISQAVDPSAGEEQHVPTVLLREYDQIFSSG